MTSLRAVAARATVLLCDADGNLFPSEEPAFEASARVASAFLAQHGQRLELDPDELRRQSTGRSFRATLGEVAARRGIAAIPPEELERWVLEERHAVTAHLAAVLKPDPEVREPLQSLAAAGYRLAAVSSSATERLDACFVATDLDDLIPKRARFSAEDSLPEPASKPDPAVYRHACQALGIDPERAVAVEDSVPGVLSAVRAGIPTVGNLQFVPYDERHERDEELRRAGAPVVVASWRELEAALSPS
ncbi:MAG TPA: HAD family phosphatase [Acidimicrobiales bacterium]|nr:HAD family phosphatase [Acidimicrobiales bacterium]